MKPIRLKIAGLNSFSEEQVIDFEKLTSQGFFGIFGPTGSGKTTILDGITLALYGKNARGSENFINVNTNAASVSFRFQISGAEIRQYQVDRVIRLDRNGQKKTGTIRLWEVTADGLEVLEDQERTVTKACQEIIGLSYEDFTRTVLLPQGKFSEFLLLEGKSRREMLERLFNLEKYGDGITRKLAVEIGNVRDELSELRGQLTGFEDIHSEALSDITGAIEKGKREYEDCQSRLQEKEARDREYEAIWQIQKELEDLEEQDRRLLEKKEEHEQELKRIALAESAGRVLPLFEKGRRLEREHQEAKGLMMELLQQQERLQLLRTEKKTELEKYADERAVLLPTLKIEENVLQGVLLEQKELNIQKEILREGKARVERLLEERDKLTKSHEQNMEEKKNAEARLEELAFRIDELAIGEEVRESFQRGKSLTEKLEGLEELKKKAAAEKAQVEKAAEDQGRILSGILSEKEELERQYLVLKGKTIMLFGQELQDTRERRIQLERRLSEKLTSYEELKEAQYRLRQEQAISLLKSDLKEGEPCPVCGSREHAGDPVSEAEKDHEPWDALEALVEKTELELTGLRSDLTKLDVEEKASGLKLEQLRLEELLPRELKEFQQEIQEKGLQLERGNALFGEYENGIRKSDLEYKRLELLVKDQMETMDRLAQEIGTRDFLAGLRGIQEKLKERSLLEGVEKKERVRLEELQNMSVRLVDPMNGLSVEIAAEKSKVEEMEKNLRKKEEELHRKTGGTTDVGERLREIRQTMERQEQVYQSAEREWKAMEESFGETLRRRTETSGRAEELMKYSEAAIGEYRQALETEGFSEVEELLEGKMDDAELRQRKLDCEEYRRAAESLLTRRRAAEDKLQGKRVEEQQRNAHKEQLLTLRKERDTLLEELVKRKQERERIETKLQELKELIQNKEILEHKSALLSDLESLFRGKKFIEFIAMHQLRYVSKGASRRLQEITNGSYGMEVDEAGQFIIRDFKNGGVKRGASTLSGGEIFLASLALALALSAQIQLKGKAPLELFFLDEGFGTLDDDLLEVVIGSLERIHHDKLKIGIISHVDAIKSRVPVKLMIQPAKMGLGGSRARIEVN